MADRRSEAFQGKQVLHALNRLTFGPRPGDVDRVRRLGIERWIQQQLQPPLIAENPVVEARLQPLETRSTMCFPITSRKTLGLLAV